MFLNILRRGFQPFTV